MNLIDEVRGLMTTELVTICKNEPVQQIETLFATHNIHHILVVNNCKLEGIVSKSDYLYFKRGFNDHNTDKRIDLFRMKKWKVKDIMTTGIAKLDASEKILTALKLFQENRFHAIPILEGEKLVGILTTYDIIEYLVKSKNNKAA